LRPSGLDCILDHMGRCGPAVRANERMEFLVSDHTPRVSIGLPVYNGADYLAAAIDSLLAQTFRDFELIIADNASTDATEAICRERAARDGRIRYIRHAQNLGAMRNFNYVVEAARARYFKWAAHDDMHEPEYLARCVEVLDSDPSVVLAHARARDIDAQGAPMVTATDDVDAASRTAPIRFRQLCIIDHSCVALFGVMRVDVLRATPLHRDYAGCDRVLLAEIGLAGRFHHVPEQLFVRRQHGDRSVQRHRDPRSRGEWFDPAQAGSIAPTFLLILEGYRSAIRRARISPVDKWLCHAVLLSWVRKHRAELRHDASLVRAQRSHASVGATPGA
jgi:glycosyltransferase involved in cell wall biosynthesis